MKAINKQEQGQLLILLVLIIFAFSTLVTVPLLNFMSTGIVTTKNDGLHAQEIYAAEAGVRDAIWKIKRVVPGVPKQESDPSLQYAISGNVNGKSVNVTISWIDSETYRVHSLATNLGTGHQSTIDSDIDIDSTGGLDLSAFTKNALTSPGTISTKTSDYINGDVWIENSENFTGGGHVSGNMTVGPITGWPTADLLETYFSHQVDETSPYATGTINIAQSSQCGPLYAQGASGGGYTITGTGQLKGIIYVVGDLYFDQNANINLNGYTIFVTGQVSTHGESSLAGPGAIIALGNISFQPHVSPSYIFVMSVTGQVSFQPQGNFVGAVCGDSLIKLQPNCTLTWQSPGVANLDVPGLYNTVSIIKTWTIH
jgi:hypothetical protein